jgi:NAD(P)-dependent dehydrogenase (short-subunit alcohol dehydrogenase family)
MKTPSPDLVLVTGGASGIGAAVVEALASAGMRPVVTDIVPVSGAVDGAIVWERPFNVAEAGEVSLGVSEIERRHGPLHGVVNAAGILGKMHAPERVKLENWDREMAIDLRGTFLVCREAGARMAARRRGAIVNVASIAGMTSAPTHAYAAAKAGVIQLTVTLAAEWGRRGVRVNAVSPGFTRTPALEAGLAGGALSRDALTRPSAMGRLVEPDEVAQAIVWLIGPKSSGVTGVNLPVDAGFLAGVTWEAYGGFRPE